MDNIKLIPLKENTISYFKINHIITNNVLRGQNNERRRLTSIRTYRI